MGRVRVPKRFGIFGGTFDPPHIGHQILAEEAAYQLGLDRVLWVLTPDPPHKSGQKISALDHRRQMVESCIKGNPTFLLSEVDIDRPAPHYALDTVKLLQKKYPDADLVYLIGGDSLRDLPTWHKPQEFVMAASALGVMCRPGEEANLRDVEEIIPGVSKKVEFIDAPLLEISSSRIREMVAGGGPYRYYLPGSVYEIITRLRLYRD